MRVECQHCGSTQPHDWAAGDLCVACGRAARSELRCFWCTEWTPEGRFCRTCGAELVPAGSYGAARMLKDAGTDRFTIPKMLRELDPAQIENFTRIYNAQLGAVRQHVDQVHFLERFSSLDVHAPALEEELVRRLPWPELPRPPPLDEGSDLERAQALAERSPFAATRALATVVRLRLDDWGTLREVQWMLSGGAGPLQAEAALALTSWRVLYAHGRPRERALRSQLLEILRGLPASSAVVVRLGALGEAVDAAALEGALHEPDRETALAAALVLGAVAPLSSALEGRDLLAREAAAERLVELGRLAEAEAYLRGAPPDAQAGLLKQALRLARPLTAWSELLLELVEGTADPTVRARAAQALCRAIPPGWGVRVAERAAGDRGIYQALLSKEADLPQAALTQVLDRMLEGGHFSSSQYGLREAAQRGAISDGFVPARLLGASPEVQKELLRLGEVQLEARRDPGLERAFYQVVFGPHPAEVRAAAWWSLHRVYRRDDRRGEGPLRLERGAIEALFDSVDVFFRGLTEVVKDRATLKEVGLFDMLARLFASTDAASVPSFLATDSLHDLVRALLRALPGDYWPQLREAMAAFLGQVGGDPRWREEVILGLEGLDTRGNYHFELALRTLRLARFELPHDREWPHLPLDFVPSRFSSAAPEAWPILLDIADQQLIRQRDVGLRSYLLNVAVGAFHGVPGRRSRPTPLRRVPNSVRLRALAIVEDRGGLPPLGLSAAQLEPIFGPLSELAPGLLAVLGDAALLEDRQYARFLARLLEAPEPAAVTALLEGLPGAWIRTLVEALSAQPSGELGARISALLAAIGARSEYAALVIEALDNALGTRATQALERLRREVTPPDASELAPQEAGDPWLDKQAEVERLAAGLQARVMEISLGPAPPEEKARLITELQVEFQARVKAIYG